MSEMESTPDVPGSWDEVFKHPRFKSLNERAKTAEQALASMQAAQDDAEKRRLAEEQKWQALAEKYATDLTALQTQAEGERLARLRLEIGQKVGLPVELANLLTGTDESGLLAHAQTLLPLVKPSTPGVPPAPTRTPVAEPFTVDQLSDPKFVRENADKIWAAGGQPG
ncbi:MAG: hypothetical protein KJ063_02240 [Anaerolineae bacterium]|nr:hypothetical protein [Anaerolineae bacterium]